MCYLDAIQTYWSANSHSYSAVNKDELDNAQTEVWDALIAEHLPVNRVLRILDVGCGPGFFSILLARHGHHVTGVDYSDEMLQRAAPMAAAYSDAADIEFFRADAQALPFDNQSFDAVLSRNLTWSLEHPERGVHRMAPRNQTRQNNT